MTDKRPHWYPVLCDEQYYAQLRKDYPDTAGLLDADLLEYYNNGRAYSTFWDHVGDAYQDYAPLATAFLKAESRVKALEDAIIEAMRLSSFTNAGENMNEILSSVILEQGDD